MNIVMLGPPGAGKGTIGARLARRLDIARLSTGDLLREEIAAQTPFGKYAGRLINQGNYIPDERIVAFVLEELKQEKYREGVLFDGFPRTVHQAELMEERGWTPDYIIYLQAPEEVLVERLSNRRVCNACGEVFNLITHPPTGKDCDVCGGKLIQREDDRAEVIRKRIGVYRKKTAELVSFYQGREEFLTIDARPVPEDIINAILPLLE